MLLILKLRSLFVGDGKLFLKISQMLVVCIICYCYNFHIFLSFPSESRVVKGLLSLSCEALYLSPGHVILTVYIVFNIVHCAKSMVY